MFKKELKIKFKRVYVLKTDENKKITLTLEIKTNSIVEDHILQLLQEDIARVSTPFGYSKQEIKG